MAQSSPLSAYNLVNLLRGHAVELVFNRRIYPPKKAKWGYQATPSRRMFATNSVKLLSSQAGNQVLLHSYSNYHSGGHPGFAGRKPGYNIASKNLVCAYDLFRLEYRMIPVESAHVIFLNPEEFKPIMSITEEYFQSTEDVMEAEQELEQLNRLPPAQRMLAKVQSRIIALEKRKKEQPKLKMPMPLMTDEDIKLFWIYWRYNIQPKSSIWRLQFENIR